MVRRFDPTNKYDRRARVAILIIVGIMAMARGVMYFGPRESLSPEYFAALDPVIPIEVWGGIWVLSAFAVWAGISCPRIARWAMSTIASLCGMWCVSYFLAWAILDSDVAYVTSAGFLALCAMTAVFTYLMEPSHLHAPRRDSK